MYQLVHVGESVPDLTQPQAIIDKVVSALESGNHSIGSKAGLMAVEVLKDCTVNHVDGSEIRTPVLERAAAFVLASSGAEAFGVRVKKEKSKLLVIPDPPESGKVDSVLPVICLLATKEERVVRRLSQAVLSVPYAEDDAQGFTLLRGFETIIHPTEG